MAASHSKVWHSSIVLTCLSSAFWDAPGHPTRQTLCLLLSLIGAGGPVLPGHTALVIMLCMLFSPGTCIVRIHHKASVHCCNLRLGNICTARIAAPSLCGNVGWAVNHQSCQRWWQMCGKCAHLSEGQCSNGQIVPPQWSSRETACCSAQLLAQSYS